MINFIIYFILGLGVAFVLRLIILNNKKTQNEGLEILKSQDASFLRLHDTISILELNNTKMNIQVDMLKRLNGTEFIVPAGPVQMVLVYERTGGIPGVAKVNHYTDKTNVTLQVEKGKLYEVVFDTRSKEFALEEKTKFMGKTALYKKFLEKYPQ